MPNLIGIGLPSERPAHSTGVEIMHLDFLNENRPFEPLDRHCDADLFEVLLEHRRNLLAKLGTCREQELEFKWFSVFLQNIPAREVIPSGRFEQRQGSFRVIRIGLDVLIVFRAVYIKRTVDNRSEPKEDFLQNHFTVDEHGHCPPNSFVRENRPVGVPPDIVIAREVIGKLLEIFLKSLGLGLPLPLNWRKTHLIQAALLQHLKSDGRFRDNFENYTVQG